MYCVRACSIGEYGILVKGVDVTKHYVSKVSTAILPGATRAPPAKPAGGADANADTDAVSLQAVELGAPGGGGGEGGDAADGGALAVTTGDDGDGGGGGGAQTTKLDELLKAVDTMGGLLLDLQDRLDAQDTTLADVAARVDQSHDIGVRNLDVMNGVMAGVAMGSAASSAGGMRIGMRSPRLGDSPREAQMREASAHRLAAFRTMRADGGALRSPFDRMA